MKKIGLVLEGGGLRGLYTAGVLDTFMDNNIEIDTIIGVSAGALFGVNYFSKQRGRALRYNKKYSNDKRYMSLRSFLLTGNYINKKFAYYKMSNELDKFDNKAFKNNKKKMYAVATRLKDGAAEYFEIKDPIKQMEELRATSAIPVLTRIVKINNEKYLDGGVADSLPIDKMKSLGMDKIIVVETQPKNYKKKPLKKSLIRFIKIKYIRYPKFIKAMINRHERYNEVKKRIIELENKKEIFVIRPSYDLNIDIKNKDEKKYQEVYDLGVKDTKKIIKELKEYLRNR